MKQIRSLLLDMDGVLWHGERPLPGFVDFFATLRRLDIQFAMATNNASRTVDQYVSKFARFGVTIEPWQVLSSAETTGAYLAQEYSAETRVYVVGDDGLRHALRSRGFDVLNDHIQVTSRAEWFATVPQYQAELVVVGFTEHATFADFAAATYYINNGARFVGSNPDKTYPSEIGPLPGAGSFLAIVECATGVEPTVIGKPYRYIFDEAAKRLGGAPESIAMVGDRLETDIEGGYRAGMQTVLVLSGIATADDAAAYAHPPTYVFSDITALASALEAAQGSS
jgi:4-nitrophenyl phosphatase